MVAGAHSFFPVAALRPVITSARVRSRAFCVRIILSERFGLLSRSRNSPLLLGFPWQKWQKSKGKLDPALGIERAITLTAFGLRRALFPPPDSLPH